MRIGLFTDTYRPTINGITFVVETLKHQLEAEGHVVYVFCPARTIRPSKRAETDEPNIIRFPSFRSGFFDDFDFTVFSPPSVLRQIGELDLDVVHIFTPSQVGLIGIQAAVKHDIPFVVQHSTDLYEFVEHYPSVLPGVLALVGIIFPMTVKMKGKDVREILRLYRPRAGVTKWNQDIISKGITLLYSKADAVIVLCRKSRDQLKSWQTRQYSYDLTLLPNGVNALPKPTKTALEDFRASWGLSHTDEVFGYVGRLGEEKNLAVLIRAFDKVIKSRPNAKLLFVGDFEYRATLEAMAAELRNGDRVVFTGAIAREQLGVAYAALDVFVFPSLKDTQGWVLHEAAHAGLPIVLTDRGVSEVVVEAENGYYARNNATDFARKIVSLLGDAQKRAMFGKRSKELAASFTERKQTRKLVKLYESVIVSHASRELDQ